MAKAIQDPSVPVTLTATDNFSIVINGTLVSFMQGQTIVADASMQAAFTANNAPVA